MNRVTPWFACAWLLVAGSAWTSDPLLEKLPPGFFVSRSIDVPASARAAVGKKLGGSVLHVSNTVLQVHGRPIQVNVIRAENDTSAGAIHAGLLKIKPAPFCVRQGLTIVEYVGQNLEPALATKTSYELGLLKKPSSVRYRVVAELATIDRADYMSCNVLFNHFLALGDRQDAPALRNIDELARKFTFGTTLTLRNPQIPGESAKHTFEPLAPKATESSCSVSYKFDKVKRRHGVPYVTATIETTVDDLGLRAANPHSGPSRVDPTSYWPSDDPALISLANEITHGKTDNQSKVLAILEWLQPGKNIKYSGQTGSRWGTKKVFDDRIGHCWDFSDCFVTLCRASKIPSRQVAGWLYGASGHVWAEYYREGKGWQQVDPTGGGKLLCGIYHIAYFTSYDGEMPIVYLSMPKIDVIQ